jgi:hypothetical protein
MHAQKSKRRTTPGWPCLGSGNREELREQNGEQGQGFPYALETRCVSGVEPVPRLVEHPPLQRGQHRSRLTVDRLANRGITEQGTGLPMARWTFPGGPCRTSPESTLFADPNNSTSVPEKNGNKFRFCKLFTTRCLPTSKTDVTASHHFPVKVWALWSRGNNCPAADVGVPSLKFSRSPLANAHHHPRGAGWGQRQTDEGSVLPVSESVPAAGLTASSTRLIGNLICVMRQNGHNRLSRIASSDSDKSFWCCLAKRVSSWPQHNTRPPAAEASVRIRAFSSILPLSGNSTASADKFLETFLRLTSDP